MQRRKRVRVWKLCAAGLVLSTGLVACTTPKPASTRNLIVIVIDTLRADRVGFAEGEGLDTPNLRRLASDAVVFSSAYSTTCWTVPSHGSLFTGLLPMSHNATQENPRLDPAIPTLAEKLSARGYETIAFTNNSWLSNITDLTRGFSTVEPMWRHGRERQAKILEAIASARAAGEDPAAAARAAAAEAEAEVAEAEVDEAEIDVHPTVGAIKAWLDNRDPGKPFLMFVNLIEPHWPYNPPEEFLRKAAGARPGLADIRTANFSAIQWYSGPRRITPAARDARRVRYNAEVLYVDTVVGEIVEMLKAADVYEDALLVLTSDHGENLGEHGHHGHSFTLYETAIRIPLLIRPPGGAGSQASRRKEPVSLPDVYATLANAAGLPADEPKAAGADLLGAPLAADRPIVSEYYEPKTFLDRFLPKPSIQEAVAQYRRRLRSLRVGDEKLIWASDGRHELYNLAEDPDELEDLAAVQQERVAALSARLEEIVASRSMSSTDIRPPLSLIDPETVENLRALGYIP